MFVSLNCRDSQTHPVISQLAVEVTYIQCCAGFPAKATGLCTQPCAPPSAEHYLTAAEGWGQGPAAPRPLWGGFQCPAAPRWLPVPRGTMVGPARSARVVALQDAASEANLVS